VSVSLPGDSVHGGFWPAFWTMGNLGRPGYGATTDGLWPSSYDSCDVGIMPNQTYPGGTTPEASIEGAWGDKLSYLPGMRYPSCTCPGEDHPGPNNNVGRSVPEIDLIEAQVRLLPMYTLPLPLLLLDTS
jgi:beta-glucanase (GH16 family)